MPFDLEINALIASGIEEGDQVAAYISSLGFIHQQFIREMKSTHDPLTSAKALFDWLWVKKPARYELHGSYRLSEVIDSNLTKDSSAVGNCLGLTLLYNCLLRRMGMDTGALYLENAFGTGPHVLTILRTKDFTIDIENILREGFDYKGHLNDPTRVMWGNRELIADIYCSRGNDGYVKGNYSEALKDYDRAINLNPGHERARLNKVILLDKMQMKER
jgi:tetratricopeptide (TPR) repeat protein